MNKMKQYTDECQWIGMEKLIEKQETKLNNSLENNQEPIVKVYWYAANPQTKRICRKRELKYKFL